MAKTIIFLIKCYQYFLRCFFGGYCRFTPSCSEYAIAAIDKYGVITGMKLLLWRLLRCQPWCCGGEDQIP